VLKSSSDLRGGADLKWPWISLSGSTESALLWLVNWRALPLLVKEVHGICAHDLGVHSYPKELGSDMGGERGPLLAELIAELLPPAVLFL
jgi:hypothetical protein